jgi:hypothetical protein
VALAEFLGLGLQGFVGQRRNRLDSRALMRATVCDVLLDQPVIAAAENLLEKVIILYRLDRLES